MRIRTTRRRGLANLGGTGRAGGENLRARRGEMGGVLAARATNLSEMFERAPGEKGGDLRNLDWVAA